METLVTGGNGLLGRHLIRALLARGDRVRIVALPGEDASGLERRGVAVHRGDVRRRETLVRPMEGVDVVFHLAAMMGEWRPLAHYRAVNVEGTRNVCMAALAAGVRRLVHLSTTSVYGVTRGRAADESFPLLSFPDPYPITKAEGDMVVQRMISADRLPGVVVRPDQIFGPGDWRHFAALADRLGAGKGIVVGRGDNALPLVYVTDVVQGLLLALDHDAALGQTFNITNDEPLTQRQFMDAVARGIGAPPPRLCVPYRALYAAGYVAERLAHLTPGARRPPITRLGVAFLGTDKRHSLAKARASLGYRPRVPLRDGVALASAWYLQRSAQTATAALGEVAVAGAGDSSR